MKDTFEKQFTEVENTKEVTVSQKGIPMVKTGED